MRDEEVSGKRRRTSKVDKHGIKDERGDGSG